MVGGSTEREGRKRRKEKEREMECCKSPLSLSLYLSRLSPPPFCAEAEKRRERREERRKRNEELTRERDIRHVQITREFW